MTSAAHPATTRGPIETTAGPMGLLMPAASRWPVGFAAYGAAAAMMKMTATARLTSHTWRGTRGIEFSAAGSQDDSTTLCGWCGAITDIEGIDCAGAAIDLPRRSRTRLWQRGHLLPGSGQYSP